MFKSQFEIQFEKLTLKTVFLVQGHIYCGNLISSKAALQRLYRKKHYTNKLELNFWPYANKKALMYCEHARFEDMSVSVNDELNIA